MRVVVRSELVQEAGAAVDLCSINGWHSVLDSNPDLLLLVSSPDCGQKCDTLKQVVDRLADQAGRPVMEIEFTKKMEGECPSMDKEVRAEVGQVVVYRGGREVGRRKGSLFAEQDRTAVEGMLRR